MSLPEFRDRPTVLLVDDDPESLGFLTEALEHAGLTVFVVLNGGEALQQVEQLVPDLILLDAVMPGLDGFQTCRLLKQGNAADVPIIFMTGLDDTAHMVQGLQAGGVDYVTKPVILEQLLARIRVHLANARADRSARSALDASGKTLLSVTPEGSINWLTPAARRMLAVPETPLETDCARLPDPVQAWLAGVLGGRSPPRHEYGYDVPHRGRRLRFRCLGRMADQEVLIGLAEGGTDADDSGPLRVLEQRFSLTPREAEVLLWLSRGKSNRDIGAILELSHRTVNKHLEHVYVKMGVESRAAASALASRALGDVIQG